VVTASTARLSLANLRCHWRPIILAGSAVVLFGAFWFASRYPQLLSKAEHLGQALPSMAYSSEVMTAAAVASVSQRILATAVNWLASMGIGMTFGVLLGALLHTLLRYYPLPYWKQPLSEFPQGSFGGGTRGHLRQLFGPGRLRRDARTRAD
jgi:hypothetical protein